MYLLYFPLTFKHNTYHIIIAEIPVENKMAHTFFSFCFYDFFSIFDFSLWLHPGYLVGVISYIIIIIIHSLHYCIFADIDG